MLSIYVAVNIDLHSCTGTQNRDLLLFLAKGCCESNRHPSPNAAENELAKSKEELAKREIEEFERFCFKKRFPKIPDDIIYPVTEEDIRSKMKIPVDDESFRSLERPDGEMKLPKIYLTRD